MANMDGSGNEKWDTTVVSLEDFSFDHLKLNLEYSFPANRSRKLWDYLAIYRIRPVSAITHYARIDEVIEDAEVSGKYRLMTFQHDTQKEATKVLLKDLKELNQPVRSEKGDGIQGAYYTKLEHIKKASTIPELRSLRGD